MKKSSKRKLQVSSEDPGRPKKIADLISAAKQGDFDTVKRLAQDKTAVDGKDTYTGETALMSAAGRGFREIVLHLSTQGADIKARDSRGNTSLDYAASENKTDIIGALMELGADIHSKNNLNWNALMQASFKGRYEAAEILLNAGVSHKEIDLEKGASALALAKISGNQKLIELLQRHGAKERTIRERAANEAYFLISDCDICTYLPHFRVELTHAYSPEEIPGLVVIHEEGSSDYKADETILIKKCRHCGTYYDHYHYIDTEDSIGGAGPICQHRLSRISLFQIQIRLEKLGKSDELSEVRARHPQIVHALTRLCLERRSFMPYIQPYVIETLCDFFCVNGDWASVQSLLLEHPGSGFPEATRKHIHLIAETKIGEGDAALPAIHEELIRAYRKWIADHSL